LIYLANDGTNIIKVKLKTQAMIDINF